MSDGTDEPAGITETEIRSSDPELTLNVINGWPQAAQRMADHGDAYEGAVRAPAWEGATAGAIITTAGRHNSTIADDTDTINALHRRAGAAMDNVIKTRTAVLDLIDGTRKGTQFTVSDDLRVTAANLEDQPTAREKEMQIRQAAQKWADAETFAATEIRAGAQPLTGRGNQRSGDEHNGVQLVDHNIPLQPPPLSAARRRAVEYADRWAGGPGDPYKHNPEYDYWGGEGNPGDCTNFASQVMRAGGFKDVGNGVDDWHRGDVDDWYYNSGLHFPGNERSSTWTAARNNHDFITGPADRGQVVGTSALPSSQVADPLAPSKAGLIPGDLIYYYNSDGTINHAAVYVGQETQNGHVVDVVDQHAYGNNNFRNDWMPDSDHYWGGQAQAEFVHLKYPGE